MIGKHWWERGEFAPRRGARGSGMTIVTVLVLFVLTSGIGQKYVWADDGTDGKPAVVRNEAATQEPIQSDPEEAERLPTQIPESAAEKPWSACMPTKIPADVERVFDAQRAVYEAVFVDSYDPCLDSTLTLDALDLSYLPALISGTNTAGETFLLEIVDWSEIDTSPPPSQEMQQSVEWPTVAGLLTGEIVTDLGSITVNALAVSYDQLGGEQGSLITLAPFFITSERAVEALRFHYQEPANSSGNENEKDCNNRCGGIFDDDVEECQQDLDFCKLSLVLVGPFYWTPWSVPAFLAGYLQCTMNNEKCLTNAFDNYDGCVYLCKIIYQRKKGDPRLP